MKKILIVSRSFYPDISPRAFRTTELVKEFARQGHSVTLITSNVGIVQKNFAQDFNINIRSMGDISWPSINLNGKGLILIVKRVLRRIFQLTICYPELQYMFMVNRALKNIEREDLLISIAVPYPVHWGVALRRNKKNKIAKVWVADCGDPFMGQENDSFKYPFYFKYVEKWFMRKVDFISVPTEGSISGYYPEFHSKIRVIPQGFNFSEVVLPKVEIKNEVITFGYAGMFIPSRRDPRELLEFLCKLKIDFKFHIYTKNLDIVKSFEEKSNHRIIVHSYIPRLELLQKLAIMDFVINFENVGAKQTPSKLIDYAVINKPILSIKTGNLDKELVLEFLSGDYSKQFLIENSEQYKIQNVCIEFINLIR